MRKSLRMLLLAVVLLVVPAANALEEIVCIPGDFIYFNGLGYQCTYREQGTQCLLCSYTITVMG
jgi:hypothetical protein